MECNEIDWNWMQWIERNWRDSNGTEWNRLEHNGVEWNYLNWAEMNGMERNRTAVSEWNWLKLNGSQWDWMELNRIELLACNWMRLNTFGWNWMELNGMELNEIEWNWMVLNENLKKLIGCPMMSFSVFSLGYAFEDFLVFLNDSQKGSSIPDGWATHFGYFNACSILFFGSFMRYSWIRMPLNQPNSNRFNTSLAKVIEPTHRNQWYPKNNNQSTLAKIKQRCTKFYAFLWGLDGPWRGLDGPLPSGGASGYTSGYTSGTLQGILLGGRWHCECSEWHHHWMK